MFHRLPPVVPALMLVLSHGAPLLAQSSTTGAIRGFVKDQQGGVLEDVAILATSLDAARPAQTTSQADGSYRVTDLTPGTYTLTAERQGFAKFVQEDIRVGAGLTLGLDITLQVSGVAETVEVRHAPPMLEVARPGQTINIAGDFQQGTPLNARRAWHQFMELIPGVTGMDRAALHRSYEFRGSFAGSHVFRLDGLDVMGANINSNTMVSFSTEAIADVQVKTAIADASVPLGVGVVADVVTRSGTNDFHGTASLIYQNRNWNDSNLSGGTPPRVSLLQPDLSLGGPVLRDRTWFFTSYRYLSAVTGISRTPQQLATLQALSPAFRPFDASSHSHLFTGKITHRIGARHDLMLSAQYDRNPTSSSNPGFDRPLLTGDTRGPWYAVRLSSVFGPNVTGRFAATYNRKRFADKPNDYSRPQRTIFERVAVSGGSSLRGINDLAILEAFNSDFSSLGAKWVASADLTYVRQGPLGSHEVTFGGYFQRNIEGFEQGFVNDGAAVIEEVLRDPTDLSRGTIPFHRTVFSPPRVALSKSRARDVAGYVQDVWRPTPRVTIAAGVRVDAIQRQDLVFDREIQDSVEIGPRFGATLAVDSASRHIVHAAAGRVHDALPQTQGSVGFTTFTREDTYDLNLDGVFDTTFVTPGLTQLAANRFFDPSFHQPYINEVTAGYRGQFFGTTALDIAWNRREYRHNRATVEVNALYENGVFVGYRDETQNQINMLTNDIWGWPVYSGLTVQLTSRSAPVQLLGSYTRNWRHLAGTWQPNLTAAIIEPDAYPNNRGLTQAERGSGPSRWRDHVIRMGGILRWRWGLQIAADYSIQTGVWSGVILTQLAAPDPRFGPPTVRLSNGRVVSNPLATTTRFAYPTRGDGQIEADTLHLLNLRLTKEFRLAFARVQLSADVYNLPNAGADQDFISTNLTSASFGLRDNRQVPRSGQISMRVIF